MIRVLVGDNTFDCGAQIASYLCSKGMDAYTRRNDCELLYSQVIADEPSVVILNAVHYYGQIASLVCDIHTFNENIKIIVLSPFEEPGLKDKIIDNGAYAYIVMPYTSSDVYNCIIRAMKTGNDVTNLENKIFDFLIEINAPIHLNGFYYTAYAIEFCIADRTVIGAITTELYPKVAKKCDTSPERVERSIRHLVEMICSDSNVEYLKDKLSESYLDKGGRLTNSEFIVAATDSFCQKYNIMF